jgi:hypothetical protein
MNRTVGGGKLGNVDDGWKERVEVGGREGVGNTRDRSF